MRMLILLVLAAAASGADARLATIYSFQGGADGSYASGLIRDSQGILYGTTPEGGSGDCSGIGCGDFFELIPPAVPGGAWVKTELYSFEGCGGAACGSSAGDAEAPGGGLVFGPNGSVYGATGAGGLGYGTVFELTPPASPGGAWAESVIYRFQPSGGGFDANPGLAVGADGTLYGTTGAGGYAPSCGHAGCGTVFKLTPPAAVGGDWKETVIYRFTGRHDGKDPNGGPVFGLNGALYGTTLRGGSTGRGTVFALTPPASPGGAWMHKVLYSFQKNPDAHQALPGLAVGANGTLYGASREGGDRSGFGRGTVFQLNPPASSVGTWTEGVILSFKGGGTGWRPYGGVTLAADGSLYGSTYTGGIRRGGTLFKLTPPTSPGGSWTQTVLYRLKGQGEGSNPAGNLIAAPGVIYGTTWENGPSGYGAVFELKP